MRDQPIGSRMARMSQPLDLAARAALESFIEPHLRQSLGEARAIQQCELQGERLQLGLQLGFPVGGYQPALQAMLQQHLAAVKVYSLQT